MSRDFTNNLANYLATTGSPSRLNFVDGTSPFSISARVRSDTFPGDMTVISKYSGLRGPILRIGGSGEVRLFAINAGEGGEEAIGATGMSTGTWYQVGGGWDGSTALYVFRNGVQDGTDPCTTLHATVAADWHIGKRPSNQQPFDGLICEVALWNVFLTTAEWRSLGTGVNPQLVRPNSLKAYWPIWGSGSPEKDYSGGGSASDMIVNGTLNPDRHAPVMPFIVSIPGRSVPGSVPGISTDAEVVYLDLQPSSVEVFAGVDATTVLVDLQASGVELVSKTDAATVYLNLQSSGIEWQAPQVPWWDPLPEGVNKWWQGEARKWREVTPTRFTLNVRGRI